MNWTKRAKGREKVGHVVWFGWLWEAVHRVNSICHHWEKPVRLCIITNHSHHHHHRVHHKTLHEKWKRASLYGKRLCNSPSSSKLSRSPSPSQDSQSDTITCNRLSSDHLSSLVRLTVIVANHHQNVGVRKDQLAPFISTGSPFFNFSSSRSIPEGEGESDTHREGERVTERERERERERCGHIFSGRHTTPKSQKTTRKDEKRLILIRCQWKNSLSLSLSLSLSDSLNLVEVCLTCIRRTLDVTLLFTCLIVFYAFSLRIPSEPKIILNDFFCLFVDFVRIFFHGIQWNEHLDFFTVLCSIQNLFLYCSIRKVLNQMSSNPHFRSEWHQREKSERAPLLLES